MLAYYFLLAAGRPVSAADLDNSIERWLEDRWQCTLDFEIEDALQKLEVLGLAKYSEPVWELIPETS